MSKWHYWHKESTSFRRAQAAYENMTPEDPPECPECGDTLEDGVCPTAQAWRDYNDDPENTTVPDEDECEWEAPDPDYDPRKEALLLKLDARRNGDY